MITLKMKGTKENVMTSNEMHDFFHERLIFKILGGYYILNKSKIHFIINVLLIACVFVLDIYLLIMAVFTITMAEAGPRIKAHALQMLCIMANAFFFPSIRFFYRKNFNAALKFLRDGIDQYSNEIIDEEYSIIKTKRVKQVRSWTLAFGIGSYFCAVSNTIQSPMMHFLGLDKNDSDEVVNPFLPLPIYTPFNTKTYSGFIVAFLSHMIHIFSMFTSLFCFLESYVSSVLQLLAQIEILNHSLANIEKRALLKHKHDVSTRRITSRQMEGILDFQRDLYMCLRTNVQHHQKIIRYFSEVKEYLGAINTFCILVFAIYFATSAVPSIKDPLGSFAMIAILVVMVIGYFQMFWVGQILADTSAYTINSLYSTPWIKCNKNYNVLLNLMYTNAKNPIILRAPALATDWTLETYGELLSAGYKLVNLLMNTL